MAQFQSDVNDHFSTTMHINLLWVLARAVKDREQELPGLSGFVSVTGYKPTNLTTIGYYPMINSPIRENVTIQECLRQSEAATNEVGQCDYIL